MNNLNPSQSQRPTRPASIAELAEEARKLSWDPSKSLKHSLKAAQKARKAARRFEETHDYECAFVEHTRAACLSLDKIPTHRDYMTRMTVEERLELGRKGQKNRHDSSKLEKLLARRYDDWRASAGTSSERTDARPVQSRPTRGEGTSNLTREATLRVQNWRRETHESHQSDVSNSPPAEPGRRGYVQGGVEGGRSNPRDISNGTVHQDESPRRPRGEDVRRGEGMQRFEQDRIARRQQETEPSARAARRHTIYRTAPVSNPPVLQDRTVQRTMSVQATVGRHVNEPFVNRRGPLANIEEYGNRVSERDTSGPPDHFPPLTPQNCVKFAKIFTDSRPTNGFLSAERARTVLLKSKLPLEQLAQIWVLADHEHQGQLGVAGFIVAMYLVEAIMSNRMASIPSQLPPSIYRKASSYASTLTSLSSSFNTASSSSTTIPLHSSEDTPITPQHPFSSSVTTDMEQLQLIDFSDVTPSHSTPVTNLQRSASVANFLSATAPLNTESIAELTPGQHLSRPTPNSTSARPPSYSRPLSMFVGPSSSLEAHHRSDALPHSPLEWEITPAQKAGYDVFFDMLDPWKTEYVEEDAAAKFFQKSKLPIVVLRQIWSLADADDDDKLSRDEFAVAMHLIREKLAGRDVPSSLLPSVSPLARQVPVDPPVDTNNGSGAVEGFGCSTTAAENIAAVPPVGPPEELPRSDTPPPPYTTVDQLDNQILG